MTTTKARTGISHLSDVLGRPGAIMPLAVPGALAGCSTWSDEVSSGEESSSGGVIINRIEPTHGRGRSSARLWDSGTSID